MVFETYSQFVKSLFDIDLILIFKKYRDMQIGHLPEFLFM